MQYNKTFTIWLTGLPSSGKSEIAGIIEDNLLERGLFIELLDENNLPKNLLIEDNDYKKNCKRFIYLARILNRNNISTIISCVSPDKKLRNTAREEVDNFLEVYISSKKANQIEYQEPEKAEIIIDKENTSSELSAKQIIKALEILNWIPRLESEDYTNAEEKQITDRLESLGYL